VVSVVDRVAVVGGPVPDAALIPRVTAALKAVAGLEAVKVSCWPMGGPDPFADRVADRMKAVPPAVAANPPAPPLAPVGPRITVAPASAPPAPPVVAAKPADDAPRTAAKVAMDRAEPGRRVPAGPGGRGPPAERGEAGWRRRGWGISRSPRRRSRPGRCRT
jgi:hypothetical protein